MTAFQLILFIISGVVFYKFFKQLFSGSHPKRGVDFEAKSAPDQIGGISRPEKIFSRPIAPSSRVDDLMQIADEAVDRDDMAEAKKALQSILYIDSEHEDAMRKAGYVYMRLDEYEYAKEQYENLLKIDADDDSAHASLANALEKLGDTTMAIIHHKKSIELDSEYAPHYYNYANTLYESGDTDGALKNYTKAYELDNSLDAAKDMIKKIEG